VTPEGGKTEDRPRMLGTPRDEGDCGAPQTPLFLKNMVFNNRMDSDEDHNFAVTSSDDDDNDDEEDDDADNSSIASPGGVGGTILDFGSRPLVAGDALDFLSGSIEVAKVDEMEGKVVKKKKKKVKRKKKATATKSGKAKTTATTTHAPPPAPEPPKFKNKKAAAPAPAVAPPPSPHQPHTIALAPNPPPSSDSFDNTALIQTLNKKCSELLQESKRADYEAKLRADAECKLIELEALKTSQASEKERMNARLQKSLSKTSKSETALLRANESLLQTKMAVKSLMGENEEYKEKLRELKGEKAGLEQGVEGERAERKRLKNQVSELKQALRKLSSLKAANEYQPSSEQEAGLDTSPAKGSTPKEMALTSQLNSMKNENVYLRRQVSSEIKCKKELESVVNKQLLKLNDLAAKVKTLEDDKVVSEARAIVEGIEGRHLSVDAEVLAEAAQLRSENESLKTELKSMTDCYKLSRDNVSLREKALQDCRTEKNLLEGEVESLRLDVQGKEKELELSKEERERMEGLYGMRGEETKKAFAKKLQEVEVGHAEVLASCKAGHKSFKRKAAAVLHLSVLRAAQMERAACAKIDMKEAFSKWMGTSLRQRLKESEVARKEGESLLKSKVNDVTDKYKIHDKKLREEMKATLKEKDGNITALRDEVKAAKNRVREEQEKNGTLESDKSTLEKEVTSLKENLTRGEGALKEAKEAKEAKEVEVNSLQRKVRDLASEIEQSAETQQRREEEIKLSKSRLQFETEKRLEDEFKSKVDRIEEDSRKRVRELEDRMRESERAAREREDLASRQSRERAEKVRAEAEEEGERRGLRRGRDEGRKELEEDCERKVDSIKQAMSEKIEVVKRGLEEKARVGVVQAESRAGKEKEEREKKHGEEMKELAERMECESRVKLGEERARSARVVERVREEKDRAAESKADEVAARLKAEYEQKMLELEAGHRSGLDELALSKKNALIKEAQKWETALENAVEEGEKRRIEEIRTLSESGREEAESSRRKIAAAAKKAIEEARRRFLAAKAEVEKAEQEKSTMAEEKKNLEALVNTLKMEVDTLKHSSTTALSEVSVKTEEVTILSGKITDLEEELEKIEAEKSIIAEREEVTVKRLEEEVEGLEIISARKYAEGVLRGKDDAATELKQKAVEYEAEKSQMLKSLAGYKERARVWDLQAERLDKDLEGKKKECENLERDLDEAKQDVAAEKERGDEKTSALARLKTELHAQMKEKEIKFRQVLEETVERKVKEVSELAAKESSKTISTFERRITVLLGEKNLAAKDAERKVNALLAENRQNLKEGEKLGHVVAAVRDAIVELSGKDVWEGIDAVEDEVTVGGAEGGLDLEVVVAGISELESEQARIKSNLEERVSKGKGIAKLIQETERALQQHSNGGSLSPGGTVSLSHVKTSRRLNEELESHIKSIDGNRKQTKALTAELQAVNEKLVEKERACRSLERREKFGVVRKLKMVAGVVDKIVRLVDEDEDD